MEGKNTILLTSDDFDKSDNRKLVKQLLNRGEIGIIPTDTVYGITCVYSNETAINSIFNLKDRDYSKPINVLISSVDMLDLLVKNISKEEKILIEKFWPGPLTIIFDKNETILDLLTASLNTIGVRMPNNKTTLNLIKEISQPLATTSANLSGFTSGTKLSDFYNNFNNKVSFIIDDGISELMTPSTIVRIVDGKPIILREGSISKSQIESALK